MMTKLEQLIKELCPNGVEYKELHEILAIKNGSDYKGFGEGDIPVYGSGGIMTYIDTFAYDKPSVLIPRKGSIDKLYYVDTPFWNVDTIFYTDIDTTKAIPRYVYHCLLREHLEQYNTAGGVPSLTQKVLNKIKIPIPPLEVQAEIVKILDEYSTSVTALQQELEAELTARKKQYEYYRDLLLDFGVHGGGTSECEWRTISGLGSWTGGCTPSMNNSKYWDNGTIPWISSKDMKFATLSDTEDHITDLAIKETSIKLLPKNITAIVARSGILKHTLPVVYIPFETTVNQDIKALIPSEDVLPRYAYFVLAGFSKRILKSTKKQGGTVDSLDMNAFMRYPVPVPTIEKQERIISILERFDKLCNDISEGLPAEIEARRKQYEYYRDKLLSFKEQ